MRVGGDYRSGGRRLQPEDGGELRPYALEVEQNFARRWRPGSLLLGEQPVTLDLNRLDVIKKQFQPIKLATDLGLEMCRQSAPIAGHEFVEPFAPIAAQRLVA